MNSNNPDPLFENLIALAKGIVKEPIDLYRDLRNNDIYSDPKIKESGGGTKSLLIGLAILPLTVIIGLVIRGFLSYF